jgi:Arc/MetJ family transcription regulator
MLYAGDMRTTVDIDDDLLLTVKEIAQQQKTTAGNVVSRLLREALRPRSFKLEYRNGVPLLPRRAGGPAVTKALVDRLRDEDE